ncbi:MAG: hypothetical protein ACLQVI_09095 [Polyangiaceae bacterium]
MTLLVALVFGLLQGVRHAVEPDHLVAVSTMLAEQRGPLRRIAYAMSWGIGHALTLLGFGIVLMMARAQISDRLDAAFEVAVSLMLIALGARALMRARASAGKAPPLAVGAGPASTSGSQGIYVPGALVVGMVHGLAGSGALTAIVVARMPSVLTGVLVVLVFGVGATVGMSLLAGALGAPLSRLFRRPWGAAGTLAVTGGAALILGLVWIVPAIERVSRWP